MGFHLVAAAANTWHAKPGLRHRKPVLNRAMPLGSGIPALESRVPMRRPLTKPAVWVESAAMAYQLRLVIASSGRYGPGGFREQASPENSILPQQFFDPQQLIVFGHAIAAGGRARFDLTGVQANG